MSISEAWKLVTSYATPERIALVTIVSAIMFVASLFATPYVLSRIPVDYFKRERPDLMQRLRETGALGAVVLMLKNLLGTVLLLLGIIMLITPGQGMLTIFIGIVLIDFPRKYELERSMISAPKVLDTVNWVRKRAGKPPLEL